MLAFGFLAGVMFVNGPQAIAPLYEHWPGLLSAALTNAVVQAIYVYAASFQPNKLLAVGGNSGNVVYDVCYMAYQWFIGRELNPRIGNFDIKTFNELRPGLILWVLLDVCCLCYQYATRGYVSDSMVVVVLFHAWYVVDSLVNESIIFSQMDITTDGFGFMLSVGDLAWVPFTYSLQARFLAFRPVHLGLLGVVGVALVQLVGYYIFRMANNEKNEFRQGRNPKSMWLLTRPALHDDVHWSQAADFWLVGKKSPSKLPRRLGHGLGVVLALWLFFPDPLLLRRVLRHSSSAPPDARRRGMSHEVR